MGQLLERILFQKINDSEIAYRVAGEGDPLILVHGWPLSGMTFREMLPALAARFTCYLVDLPGAGETRWTDRTDFGFEGQAQSVKAFAEGLGLESYSLIAHDTGATVARQLAIIDSERVKKAVFIGTEIPHHRPPWIPFFQRVSYIPGVDMVFRRNMQSETFLRSSRGFGGCFSDLDLIQGEFHDLFIKPLIDSAQKRAGQRYRLRGIDWALVDGLEKRHALIQAPVLLIWGEDDPVFPVERARRMVPQFKNCPGLKAVPDAKLFVHEERPDRVAQLCLEFLRD